MSQIKLDLKQFHHVKSDDKSTTLQHKGGHTLTLAHNSLSKEAQAQLAQLSKIPKEDATPEQKDEMMHKGAAMAKGGKVDKFNADDHMVKLTEEQVAVAKEKLGTLQTPHFVGHDPEAQAKNRDDTEWAMRQKNSVKKLAAGGPVAEDVPGQPPVDDQAVPQEAAAQPSPPKVDPEVQAKRDLYNKIAGKPDLVSGAYMQPGKTFGEHGEDPQNFDPDAWSAAENQYKAKQSADQSAAKDQQEAAAKLSMTKAAAGIGAPDQLAQSQIGAQLAAPGTSGTQPSIGGDGMPQANQQQGVPADGMDPTAGIMQGYNTEIHGIRQEAQAKGALGEQAAQIEHNAAQAQQQATQTFQDSYQKLEQERQAHMQDIQEGMINPDKYWTGDSKTGEGGHSKVMSGIGMILAGFNPTTAPNAAVNFLKYQMDKNIEAQKQNLGAKQNLLTANLRQFGNLRDATDMTRIMQNDVAVHYLQAAANKAQGGPNGLAAAAANKAIGPLQRESAQAHLQMALRQSMMKLSQGGQNGDPSNTAPAEQMVNMLNQYNPEMAKNLRERIVPGVGVSPDQPIPQDVRNQMIQRKNFDNMLQRYHAFAQQHSGSFNPSTVAEGKALAAELQGAYRNASNGGVFKEGEQKFIEKLIPDDPTQLLANFRTNPKIKELVTSNQAQLDQLKQGYGMPVQHQAPQSQIPDGSRGTYKGTQVIRQNGKWVPVK